MHLTKRTATNRRIGLLGIAVSAVLLLAVFGPISTAEALSSKFVGRPVVRQAIPFASFMLFVKVSPGEIGTGLSSVTIELDGGDSITFDSDGNVVSKDSIFLLGKGITRFEDGYAIRPGANLFFVVLNAGGLGVGIHTLTASSIPAGEVVASKTFRVI